VRELPYLEQQGAETGVLRYDKDCAHPTAGSSQLWIVPNLEHDFGRAFDHDALALAVKDYLDDHAKLPSAVPMDTAGDDDVVRHESADHLNDSTAGLDSNLASSPAEDTKNYNESVVEAQTVIPMAEPLDDEADAGDDGGLPSIEAMSGPSTDDDEEEKDVDEDGIREDKTADDESNVKDSTKHDSSICPHDIRQCPDSGAIVVRVPPDCEFAPCETADAPGSTSAESETDAGEPQQEIPPAASSSDDDGADTTGEQHENYEGAEQQTGSVSSSAGHSNSSPIAAFLTSLLFVAASRQY